VLAGPELSLAVSRGLVTHWKRWAEYKTEPIFTGYVDYFWRKRLEYQAAGNDVYEQLAKAMLNSLYGKFAQEAPKWQHRENKLADLPWSTWCEYNTDAAEIEQYRSVGWHVQRFAGKSEMRQSFPAISSFVTSYARERMRQLRDIAGCRHVYYQAVDSLIVDQIGYDALQIASEVQPGMLGKLRLLRAADDINVLGVGDYSIGEHSVLVGRKAAATINGDGSWTQAQFDGPGSLFAGLTKRAFSVRLVRKIRLASHVAGDVQPDGWVQPYGPIVPLDPAGGISADALSNALAASSTAPVNSLGGDTGPESIASTTAAMASSTVSAAAT
jgi:hypothetical protein